MLQVLLLPLLAAMAAGLAAALVFILLYIRIQRRSATGILSVAREQADRLRADATSPGRPRPGASSWRCWR